MKSKRKKKILRLVSIYCELMSKKMKRKRKETILTMSMSLVIVGENTRKHNKQLNVQECLNIISISLETNIII